MDDLSVRLVDSINAGYGVHPGHRAAHAKGVLCAGTFTPTTEALRRVPRFRGAQDRDVDVRADMSTRCRHLSFRRFR